MKIKYAPSGQNAYWFEDLGAHEILHVGAFGETLEKSLEIYGDLLIQLHSANPTLWIEFQSYKAWWFDERRRDYKLQWRRPDYEDRAHLAYGLSGSGDIARALRTYWLLKELRFYFWNADAALGPGDVVAAVARNEFRDLARYVPSVMRFAVARDICSSYLRIIFRREEEELVDRLLAETASRFRVKLQLEASIFRNAGNRM